MDAGRFDRLSRSLDARSRRGALRALGVLGAVGLADRLGATTVEARKKKVGKKKPKCPTCPEPTVCPERDTCPARTCCACSTTSGGPPVSCHFLPVGSRTSDCQAVCGLNFPSFSSTGIAGGTYVCDTTNRCAAAKCPI